MNPPHRTAIRGFLMCLSFTALLLASLSAVHGADAPNPVAKPHILIVLVDDMRYGDPQCFNPQSKIPMPHIDRLAQDGMRFTDSAGPLE